MNAETELSNKLADYANSDWINSTADIYGNSDSKIELDRSEIAELIFSTEEEMLTSKMSDLLSSPVDEKLNNVSPAKEPPLPTESEIESMLSEIRQIEQEEIQSSVEKESKEAIGENGERKNVLSNSETNK
ncbi:MAG: hypothetical protein COA63_008095 [Methylophaga sp.]|nr:hypothetical protein [Methylophaga sp.]